MRACESGDTVVGLTCLKAFNSNAHLAVQKHSVFDSCHATNVLQILIMRIKRTRVARTKPQKTMAISRSNLHGDDLVRIQEAKLKVLNQLAEPKLGVQDLIAASRSNELVRWLHWASRSSIIIK